MAADPQSGPIDVSVVVPARNDVVHLARLVPALRSGFAAQGLTAEIIVVANGCSDDTAAFCERSGVVCRWFDHGIAPARARNAGVAISSGGWLTFLDADCTPLPEWFGALRARIDRGVSDAAFGWPVLVPPGAHWLALAWERVRMAGGRTPRYINSGNLSVSRAMFDRTGGFDESRVAGEDVDFCNRVQAAGGRLELDRGFAAYHYGEPATLRGFFRRELFHAEPLTVVARAVSESPLNAVILVIGAATLVGIVGAAIAWRYEPGLGVALLALGPAVLAMAAVAKAAAGWRSRSGPGQFVQMIGACGVMLAARTVGTVWRMHNWR